MGFVAGLLGRNTTKNFAFVKPLKCIQLLPEMFAQIPNKTQLKKCRCPLQSAG